MRISDWSSDVCSSDLLAAGIAVRHLVFGDAVGIQAAELRPGLEDDDVMAVHGKAMRAGQPRRAAADHGDLPPRSEEHTSELQSLMRISYAVFCLKKKKHNEH